MPRWMYWTPLILLTVLGAMYLFRASWIAVTISETDVINAQVLRYLDEVRGGQPDDCVARPALGAWLTVICRRDGAVWLATVDRRGRVTQPVVPGA